MRQDVFSSKFLGSRIRGENVQKSEQVFGYFLGPCLVYMVYAGIAGTYLTQFYTDVLGITGGFLTMMPLVSKLLTSFLSLVIGRMIDKTHTSQGKARPWILASGILLTVCGILLYAVPHAGYRVQIAWVVISYNLFFGLAFSVYSLSHSLMVPLSTRNTKQRDSLAMLTSTGTAMLPGMLSTIIMPLLIQRIGVGDGAQGAWLRVMSILSIIAIPAVLLEYYFTKERITAETDSGTEHTISFRKQIAVCFRDRYWLMVMAFTLILQICNGLSGSSMLYYCNWVLSDSVAGGAGKQILVNMVGQAPMGIGVVVLWPLVRKFGKRRVTIIGFVIAAAGSLLTLLGSDSMAVVLGGLIIKSTGSLPTYVMAALLAETLDHIEQENGFRADGFSASVSSICMTVVAGLTQTLLLAGIQLFGYVAPTAADQVVVQPEMVRVFFNWCFTGFPMIGFAVCAVIMYFYRLESKVPEISRFLEKDSIK